jgi:hypothetical protein
VAAEFYPMPGFHARKSRTEEKPKLLAISKK